MFQQWASDLGLTNTSREGCLFDGGALKVDASVVCHDVRGKRLAAGEKFIASYGDGSEKFSGMGDVYEFKGIKLDATVTISIWVVSQGTFAPKPRGTQQAAGQQQQQRQFFGEVQFPLVYLVKQCDACLYHTWLLLGAASKVPKTPAAAGEAFNCAMDGAKNNLAAPKVCISFMRTSELQGGTRAMWTADTELKDRLTRWGPLLRSQEQHETLCALELYQHHMGEEAEDNAELQELEELAQKQSQELDGLRSLLSKARSQKVYSKETAADEVQRQHTHADRLKSELQSLQSQLHAVGMSANASISQHNETIRVLRTDREEAIGRIEEWQAEFNKVKDENEELKTHLRQLAADKESLLQIVEDLHQAVSGGGLGQTARKSIDQHLTSFS